MLVKTILLLHLLLFAKISFCQIIIFSTQYPEFIPNESAQYIGVKDTIGKFEIQNSGGACSLALEYSVNHSPFEFSVNPPEYNTMRKYYTVYVLYTPIDTSPISGYDDLVFSFESSASTCEGGIDTFRCVANAKGSKKNTVQNILSSQNLSLDIFPNPTFSEVTIKYYIPESEITNISICDVFGKDFPELTGTEALKRSSTIDFSHIPKGIYFCRLQSGSNYITKKILHY